VEYRRGHEEGGGWPGTFLDVGRGVDSVRQAAAQFPLDLSHVAIMGHSAGGQLALWSAARHRVPRQSEVWQENPLAVRGAVSLAGIIDMHVYLDRGIERCSNGVRTVLGGNYIDYPERYASVSPAELLPLGVQQVLVWAEADEVVPRELFGEYERRSKELGDSVEIVSVEGATHADLCWTGNPGWGRVLGATRRLLA
jgi:acetyl esterase/lipase